MIVQDLSTAICVCVLHHDNRLANTTQQCVLVPVLKSVLTEEQRQPHSAVTSNGLAVQRWWVRI